MPYKTQWQGSGFIVSFQGPVTIAEVQQSNSELYGNPNFDRVKYQIFDFTDADTDLISFSDADIPAATDSAASIYIKWMKVGLVGTDPHTIELFKSYIETVKAFGSQWVIETFPSVESAKAWCVK